MKLYGLFDHVDGTFTDSVNIFPDDEAAAIGLAKTFAYSNVMKEEFCMQCLGEIDEKTGTITPCIPYEVDMNEEVYSRAIKVYKDANKVEDKAEKAS